MSFSEILNKLATKKMIEGDTAFAYNLVSFADKSEENPEDDTIKAEMYKKGKTKKHKQVLLNYLFRNMQEPK